MDSAVADVLRSPFVKSWISQVREGDLTDPVLDTRVGAWARWAMTNMSVYRGLGEREYPAVNLPGLFYDPKGMYTGLKPHIELSNSVLRNEDPLFPTRLACAGNGLLFEWWLPSEVTAVKRAIFAPGRGDIASFSVLLSSTRNALVAAVEQSSQALRDNWNVVEELLVGDPEIISRVFQNGFGSETICAFYPDAALGSSNVQQGSLSITPDLKLLNKSGKWLSRRVGVWTIQGVGSDGRAFSIGCVTPRLTKTSLFSDSLFTPSLEGGAALLARGVVLDAVACAAGLGSGQQVSHTWVKSTLGSFRAVPARTGERVPQASVRSAVTFLQSYPLAADAWKSLQQWSEVTYQSNVSLTVNWEEFDKSHSAVALAVSRSETPDREDINTILPLVWDHAGKVLRLTYAVSAE